MKEVLKITNNTGVDVVFDSVGSTLLDTFMVTKECGHVVFYDMSGGDPQFIDPRMLMDTSKTLVDGDLWSYLTSENERQSRASRLFKQISDGRIDVKEPVVFKLSEGEKAHDFLEQGKSSSKVLLLPEEVE